MYPCYVLSRSAPNLDDVVGRLQGVQDRPGIASNPPSRPGNKGIRPGAPCGSAPLLQLTVPGDSHSRLGSPDSASDTMPSRGPSARRRTALGGLRCTRVTSFDMLLYRLVRLSIHIGNQLFLSKVHLGHQPFSDYSQFEVIGKRALETRLFALNCKCPLLY